MMKSLRYPGEGSTLDIKNYPGVVALKRIDDPIARQLQALALHFYDLGFCHDALVEVAKQLHRSKPRSKVRRRKCFLAKALWISSIARYFKCFGGNRSRIKLSPSKVLKDCEDAERDFCYFQALRNKHIVHDENLFSQAFTGVVLRPRAAKPKVEGLLSVAFNKVIVDDDDLLRFMGLVELTIAWVDAKRDELSNNLMKKYEQWEYDDLIALPDIPLTVPSRDQVMTTR